MKVFITWRVVQLDPLMREVYAWVDACTSRYVRQLIKKWRCSLWLMMDWRQAFILMSTCGSLEVGIVTCVILYELMVSVVRLFTAMEGGIGSASTNGVSVGDGAKFWQIESCADEATTWSSHIVAKRWKQSAPSRLVVEENRTQILWLPSIVL